VIVILKSTYLQLAVGKPVHCRTLFRDGSGVALLVGGVGAGLGFLVLVWMLGSLVGFGEGARLSLGRAKELDLKSENV
jgi:hypothetical protein